MRSEVHAGERDGGDHDQGSSRDEDPGERTRGLAKEDDGRRSEEDRCHRGVAARKAVARFGRERGPEIRPPAPETALQQRAPQRAQEHRAPEKLRRGSAVEQDEDPRQENRRGDQEELASEEGDRVNGAVSSRRVEISHGERHPTVERGEDVDPFSTRRRSAHGSPVTNR